MKSQEKTWKSCVAKAKTLVAQYQVVRWEIAQLAIEACDIYKGGRSHTNEFTLKQFAKEIDIPYNTLQEWVKIKRKVVDKLPANIVEQTNNLPYRNYQRIAQKVSASATKQEVMRVFEKEAMVNPDEYRFRDYMLRLQTLFFNAEHPNRYAGVKNETLKELISKLRASADLFEEELNRRLNGTTLKNNKKSAIEKAKRIMEQA